MTTLLLVVIYLAFISLGLPDSLLGAGWPVMHTHFGVPLQFAGIVSMIISFGTVVSSLASERLTKRFGTRYVTLISIALTAAALLGFSVSTAFWMICLWAIPYGLGAGSIDAALNNYVALHYSSRDMSWLHCFWGIGTIASPYIISFSLSHASWQVGYRTVAALQAGIALIVLLTLPLWRVHQNAEDPVQKAKVLGLSGALRIRGVLPLLIGFCCYCAAESVCMLWTASYLITVRGVTEARAAAFASLFFIGITAGRFLAGFVSDRIGDRNMVRIGTGIILLGLAMTLLPIQSEIAALIGFVIIGLGCAPVYPSIIHATPNHFGAQNAQAIIGLQMASAYIGTTFASPAFGWLSTYTGLWILPLYVAGFIGVMTVMLEWTYRLRATEGSV